MPRGGPETKHRVSENDKITVESVIMQVATENVEEVSGWLSGPKFQVSGWLSGLGTLFVSDSRPVDSLSRLQTSNMFGPENLKRKARAGQNGKTTLKNDICMSQQKTS